MRYRGEIDESEISRREREMLNDDEDEDGDITPKVCQLDSVRELDEDREIREITERNQQSNCWSSFSWSSLYDRGTDSSLSWADDVRYLNIRQIREILSQLKFLLFFYRSMKKKLLRQFEKCLRMLRSFSTSRALLKLIRDSGGSPQTKLPRKRNAKCGETIFQI